MLPPVRCLHLPVLPQVRITPAGYILRWLYRYWFAVPVLGYAHARYRLYAVIHIQVACLHTTRLHGLFLHTTAFLPRLPTFTALPVYGSPRQVCSAAPLRVHIYALHVPAHTCRFWLQFTVTVPGYRLPSPAFTSFTLPRLVHRFPRVCPYYRTPVLPLLFCTTVTHRSTFAFHWFAVVYVTCRFWFRLDYLRLVACWLLHRFLCTSGCGYVTRFTLPHTYAFLLPYAFTVIYGLFTGLPFSPAFGCYHCSLYIAGSFWLRLRVWFTVALHTVTPSWFATPLPHYVAVPFTRLLRIAGYTVIHSCPVRFYARFCTLRCRITFTLPLVLPGSLRHCLPLHSWITVLAVWLVCCTVTFARWLPHTLPFTRFRFAHAVTLPLRLLHGSRVGLPGCRTFTDSLHFAATVCHTHLCVATVRHYRSAGSTCHTRLHLRLPFVQLDYRTRCTVTAGLRFLVRGYRTAHHVHGCSGSRSVGLRSSHT